MILKVPNEIKRKIISFLIFDKKYKFFCIKCKKKFVSNQDYIEYYLNNKNSCPCYIIWIKDLY